MSTHLPIQGVVYSLLPAFPVLILQARRRSVLQILRIRSRLCVCPAYGSRNTDGNSVGVSGTGLKGFLEVGHSDENKKQVIQVYLGTGLENLFYGEALSPFIRNTASAASFSSVVIRLSITLVKLLMMILTNYSQVLYCYLDSYHILGYDNSAQRKSPNFTRARALSLGPKYKAVLGPQYVTLLAQKLPRAAAYCQLPKERGTMMKPP